MIQPQLSVNKMKTVINYVWFKGMTRFIQVFYIFYRRGINGIFIFILFTLN